MFLLRWNAQHSNAWELGGRVRKGLHEMYGCMLSIEPLFPMRKEHGGHYMAYRASQGWWNIAIQFSILVVEHSPATEFGSVLLPLKPGTIFV